MEGSRQGRQLLLRQIERNREKHVAMLIHNIHLPILPVVLRTFAILAQLMDHLHGNALGRFRIRDIDSGIITNNLVLVYQVKVAAHSGSVTFLSSWIPADPGA